MRLFFIFLIPLFFSGNLHAAPFYLPIDDIDEGIAYLEEDLNSGREGTLVKFKEFHSRNGAAAGVSLECRLNLLSPSKPRFRGEIIQCRINRKGSGGYILDEYHFTGNYISNTLAFRGQFIGGIEELLLPLGEAGSFLSALLLGRTDKAEKIKDQFRRAGVSHLLALSGLHRGIVTALILLIIKPMIPRRFIGYFLILFLCLYSWIIGLNFSFLRAVIMFSLMNFCFTVRIKPVLGKILILSAMVQMFAWPDCLYSWSFLLSYSAMGGILFLSETWIFWLKRILPVPVAIAFGVSLAAQAAVIPLILPGFGNVQTMGFLVGIILTPFITIYLWAGIIFILLMALSPVFLIPARYIFGGLYRIIGDTLNIFTGIPPVEWGSRAGKLLFFLSLSAILSTGVYLVIKERRFVWSRSQFKLRFPFGDKGSARDDGVGASKTVGSELSNKQRSQGADR
ncbi:MAG: ComEC/Rec2 family competence protein [Spirochaetales bacterium]|nr:ComEC/Rec2 family competence protein [Spirochaetales bacterium]